MNNKKQYKKIILNLMLALAVQPLIAEDYRGMVVSIDKLAKKNDKKISKYILSPGERSLDNQLLYAYTVSQIANNRMSYVKFIGNKLVDTTEAEYGNGIPIGTFSFDSLTSSSTSLFSFSNNFLGTMNVSTSGYSNLGATISLNNQDSIQILKNDYVVPNMNSLNVINSSGNSVGYLYKTDNQDWDATPYWGSRTQWLSDHEYFYKGNEIAYNTNSNGNLSIYSNKTHDEVAQVNSIGGDNYKVTVNPSLIAEVVTEEMRNQYRKLFNDKTQKQKILSMAENDPTVSKAVTSTTNDYRNLKELSDVDQLAIAAYLVNNKQLDTQMGRSTGIYLFDVAATNIADKSKNALITSEVEKNANNIATSEHYNGMYIQGDLSSLQNGINKTKHDADAVGAMLDATDHIFAQDEKLFKKIPLTTLQKTDLDNGVKQLQSKIVNDVQNMSMAQKMQFKQNLQQNEDKLILAQKKEEAFLNSISPQERTFITQTLSAMILHRKSLLTSAWNYIDEILNSQNAAFTYDKLFNIYHTYIQEYDPVDGNIIYFVNKTNGNEIFQVEKYPGLDIINVATVYGGTTTTTKNKTTLREDGDTAKDVKEDFGQSTGNVKFFGAIYQTPDGGYIIQNGVGGEVYLNANGKPSTNATNIPLIPISSSDAPAYMFDPYLQTQSNLLNLSSSITNSADFGATWGYSEQIPSALEMETNNSAATSFINSSMVSQYNSENETAASIDAEYGVSAAKPKLASASSIEGYYASPQYANTPMVTAPFTKYVSTPQFVSQYNLENANNTPLMLKGTSVSASKVLYYDGNALPISILNSSNGVKLELLKNISDVTIGNRTIPMVVTRTATTTSYALTGYENVGTVSGQPIAGTFAAGTVITVSNNTSSPSLQISGPGMSTVSIPVTVTTSGNDTTYTIKNTSTISGGATNATISSGTTITVPNTDSYIAGTNVLIKNTMNVNGNIIPVDLQYGKSGVTLLTRAPANFVPYSKMTIPSGSVITISPSEQHVTDGLPFPDTGVPQTVAINGQNFNVTYNNIYTVNDTTKKTGAFYPRPSQPVFGTTGGKNNGQVLYQFTVNQTGTFYIDGFPVTVPKGTTVENVDYYNQSKLVIGYNFYGGQKTLILSGTEPIGNANTQFVLGAPISLPAAPLIIPAGTELQLSGSTMLIDNQTIPITRSGENLVVSQNTPFQAAGGRIVIPKGYVFTFGSNLVLDSGKTTSTIPVQLNKGSSGYYLSTTANSTYAVPGTDGSFAIPQNTTLSLGKAVDINGGYVPVSVNSTTTATTYSYLNVKNNSTYSIEASSSAIVIINEITGKSQSIPITLDGSKATVTAVTKISLADGKQITIPANTSLEISKKSIILDGSYVLFSNIGKYTLPISYTTQKAVSINVKSSKIGAINPVTIPLQTTFSVSNGILSINGNEVPVSRTLILDSSGLTFVYTATSDISLDNGVKIPVNSTISINNGSVSINSQDIGQISQRSSYSATNDSVTTYKSPSGEKVTIPAGTQFAVEGNNLVVGSSTIPLSIAQGSSSTTYTINNATKINDFAGNIITIPAKTTVTVPDMVNGTTGDVMVNNQKIPVLIENTPDGIGFVIKATTEVNTMAGSTLTLEQNTTITLRNGQLFIANNAPPKGVAPYSYEVTDFAIDKVNTFTTKSALNYTSNGVTYTIPQGYEISFDKNGVSVVSADKPPLSVSAEVKLNDAELPVLSNGKVAGDILYQASANSGQEGTIDYINNQDGEVTNISNYHVGKSQNAVGNYDLTYNVGNHSASPVVNSMDVNVSKGTDSITATSGKNTLSVKQDAQDNYQVYENNAAVTGGYYSATVDNSSALVNNNLAVKNTTNSFNILSNGKGGTTISSSASQVLSLKIFNQNIPLSGQLTPEGVVLTTPQEFNLNVPNPLSVGTNFTFTTPNYSTTDAGYSTVKAGTVSPQTTISINGQNFTGTTYYENTKDGNIYVENIYYTITKDGVLQINGHKLPIPAGTQIEKTNQGVADIAQQLIIKLPINGGGRTTQTLSFGMTQNTNEEYTITSAPKTYMVPIPAQSQISFENDAFYFNDQKVPVKLNKTSNGYEVVVADNTSINISGNNINLSVGDVLLSQNMFKLAQPILTFSKEGDSSELTTNQPITLANGKTIDSNTSATININPYGVLSNENGDLTRQFAPTDDGGSNYFFDINGHTIKTSPQETLSITTPIDHENSQEFNAEVNGQWMKHSVNKSYVAHLAPDDNSMQVYNNGSLSSTITEVPISQYQMSSVNAYGFTPYTYKITNAKDVSDPVFIQPLVSDGASDIELASGKEIDLGSNSSGFEAYTLNHNVPEADATLMGVNLISFNEQSTDYLVDKINFLYNNLPSPWKDLLPNSFVTPDYGVTKKPRWWKYLNIWLLPEKMLLREGNVAEAIIHTGGDTGTFGHAVGKVLLGNQFDNSLYWATVGNTPSNADSLDYKVQNSANSKYSRNPYEGLGEEVSRMAEEQIFFVPFM